MDQYHHTIRRVMSTQNDSNGYRTVLADAPLDGGIAFWTEHPNNPGKKHTSNSVPEECAPCIFLDYAHDTDPHRTNQKSDMTRNMIYNGPIGYYLRPKSEHQNDDDIVAVIMLDKVVNRGNYHVTIVSDYDQTLYNDSQAIIGPENRSFPGLRQLNADTLVHQFAAVKRPHRHQWSNTPQSQRSYIEGNLSLYYFPGLEPTKESSTPASWQFGCMLRTVGIPKNSTFGKRPPSYQFIMQNVSQKTAGKHNVLKKGGGAYQPFQFGGSNKHI